MGGRSGGQSPPQSLSIAGGLEGETLDGSDEVIEEIVEVGGTACFGALHPSVHKDQAQDIDRLAVLGEALKIGMLLDKGGGRGDRGVGEQVIVGLDAFGFSDAEALKEVARQAIEV